MTQKSGRPRRDESYSGSRQKIIDAAAELVGSGRASDITVRRVCDIADVSIGTFYHYFSDKDNLLMSFVREPFASAELDTPIQDVSGRISELYMRLINKYMELGKKFMKGFYTTDNEALSAYMCERHGKFLQNTVMARSEHELNEALSAGFIRSGANIHVICQDICTIVKGCVFEWCLNDTKIDIEATLSRIIKNYLSVYTTN